VAPAREAPVRELRDASSVELRGVTLERELRSVRRDSLNDDGLRAAPEER
jgi:hypothetical protein